MAANPIEAYRRQIEKELQAGNATEHTHRPALKSLIESLAPGVTATNEPKQVECGAPDFIISRKAVHGPVTLGHIEAKDVGKPLDEIERTDQLKRYLPALPNLILTDYLEFRWYVNGEHRHTARLARVAKGGKLAPEKDRPEATSDLLTGFLTQEAQPINDPKALALRMARLTHFIRDMIVTALERDSASATLRDLHNAFEKALIPDLPIPQFADMFAQTLAYGLFAARCNHHGLKGSFKRLGAASEIPKTNPFLRQLFETITGTALDEEPYAGFVDDLAQLLADTEIDAVLADFGKRTARQDPVVHFYETFLAAYDPKLRESRGVYYTPEPVVSYLVRSVDYLLKTRFCCPNGLADTATVEYEREEESGAGLQPGKDGKKVKATSPRVLILDPACGTGTFLYTVIDHIRDEFMRQGNAGMWSGYVRNHLLPRIFGFELLMAPYAVAHFKLGMQLAGHDLSPAQREKWAYDFSGGERLGVFLTNTLEEAERRAETLFGPLRVITQEANAASEIKRNMPILAVIGNPPYSGHSANRSWEVKNGKKELTLIGRLIQDYYKVDGQPLGEKNPKWLQDDYVKFLRWGQWRIERTGAGILAFITNHGYLDNPTFRGMRRSLMNLFTDIYVLDLHGNSKKKERAPDGSPDENVFDIQQGVTLGIFVKELNKAGPAKVYHADLWGQRERKYEYLFEADIHESHWSELSPRGPAYFFVPQNQEMLGEYQSGRKISEIFSLNSVGIVTARDNLAVGWSSEQVWETVKDFVSLSPEDARGKYALGKDARDWKVDFAQEDVRSSGPKPENITRLLYRPFDNRFTYYTGRSRGFICMPRPEVMPNMITGQNVGLVWTRPMSPNYEFSVTSTRFVIDQCAVGNKTAGAGISYLGPLYLYSSKDGKKGQQIRLHEHKTESEKRESNLNPNLVSDLETRLLLSFISEGNGDLKKTFGPEDVFDYIYAVFHSPTYRTRYAEFLKSDFPRVPLTSDVKLFRSLCGLGADLVALHLLESPKLAKPIARFPVKGANQVEKGFPKYVAPGEPEPGTGKLLKEGRVYINSLTPGPSPSGRGKAREVGQGEGKGTGQYFEGIPPEVWNFHIGGYQVCDKWLKDRRGRTLTYEDLEHYCKVVTALSETIRLMAEIDAAIPRWPIA
ncbi:MAG: type ISP restriction/modification enzyme [Terriglobia bacterium]